MKRGNLKTDRIYTTDEKGNKITRYAVLVRLRGKKEWVQAKNGEIQHIYDTQAEAEKIILDFYKKVNATITEKIQSGGVKPVFRR